MTDSGADAGLRRSGIAGVCFALLIAGALSGAPADVVADGLQRGAACSVATQTAVCESSDKAAKDKAAKDKGRAKEKTKPTPKKESADAQQRTLLKSAVERLAPQRQGVADLYTIGVAGWAGEDVFIKELDGAIASLTKVLPIDGRVVRLVNRADTVSQIPLASRDNIAAAVRTVGEVMDKGEDILILFMTSHGTQGGFVLQLPGRKMVEFAPRELAKILDSTGIQNRIVIVSACYSGSFVPPLANDNTIVITAADAWNPSFGCAPGREWTFFGDALFNRSLQPGTDLQRAFNGARIKISEWELTDRLTPSNPQAHFGPAVVEKLAPLFAAQPGAAR
jgi:Peptidase C13 family